VHTVDQALTFTSGKGKATIAGKDQDFKAGDLVVVPAGTQHQFVNTGPTPLVRIPFPSILSAHSPFPVFLHSHPKSRLASYPTTPQESKGRKADTDTTDKQILYTVYSPAEHDPQTVHKTKEEGDEEEENGKDEAPEWARTPKAENEKKGLVKTDGKY